MSDIAIKVEEVGKLYRLGEVGTGTLSQDLKRWWAITRGHEDPFAKIGETNDRTKKGDSDYVWALKNINFEVKQGEVLGIIGRNGAGKSTLLKLLSKVTTPSTGNIRIKGRIASLLEVGTGFHPDLTGRENVFLNGAILGMTKREIQSKFDEIVDFAGVERYIDTPVKRYSSGMYVRLAFAVAAFLEPEILIIDEVLAVGDAEFQKKCLGRMKDVSVNDGRTVLFVSHNMGAIRGLCNTAILLENGSIKTTGKVDEVVGAYYKNEDSLNGKFTVGRFDKSEKAVVEEITIKNQHNKYTEEFKTGDDIIVEAKISSDEDYFNPNVWCGIKSKFGHYITIANTMLDGCRPPILKKGFNTYSVTFKNIPLLPQEYYLAFGMRTTDGKIFLMQSKEVGLFIVTTRMSDLGSEGPLAEETASDSISPVIPYEWNFGNGDIKSFNITDNVKR
jgi:lipopolysaccharide transport system ATP-binding protein